eukprot:jgi/Botrbrau1/23663/Bobra.55_2s0045.2
MVAIVLFACVHNAGRSQMAEALFNAAVNPSKASGVSAGTAPGNQVHPEVLRVLLAHGINVSSKVPRLLTPELAKTASLLITMGCGEACPFVPGLERLDWPLTDPKGKTEEEVNVSPSEFLVAVKLAY